MLTPIPAPDAEEDDLAEIDTSNIIQGRRTRGAKIDFTKAAAEQMDEDEDENDDDFEAPAEDDAMDTK